MTAFIVSCVIAGLIGTSFHEPGAAKKSTKAPRPTVQRAPVFVPVAWAPAPPPPAPVAPYAGHVLPMHWTS